MDNEEILSISSLGELLMYMKNNEFSDKKYFFRGESDEYERRDSSAYRRSKNMSPFSVTSLLSEYYREVGYSLSSLESENFLAYSQHHGLATNLLDITDSILIATFFATQNNQDKPGYVYCYDASNCLFLPPNIVPEDNLMLFNNLHQLNKPTIEVLFYVFNGYYVDFYNFCNLYEEYLLKLEQNSIDSEIRSILAEIQNEIDVFRNSKNEYISYSDDSRPQEVENSYIISLYYLSNRIIEVLEGNTTYQKYVKEIKEVGKKMKLRWVINDPVNIITSLLLIFIVLMKNAIILQDFFNDLPPIIYKSRIKFDRIRNQSGLFIFQNNHMEYRGTASEYVRYHPQNINENKIIKIVNKKDIREELENLGINEVYIYGDPDNIAKYMMRKYFT